MCSVFTPQKSKATVFDYLRLKQICVSTSKGQQSGSQLGGRLQRASKSLLTPRVGSMPVTSVRIPHYIPLHVYWFLLTCAVLSRLDPCWIQTFLGEIRVVHKLAHELERDIILGSTSVDKPNTIVDLLYSISPLNAGY